jgi:hypothetical protein
MFLAYLISTQISTPDKDIQGIALTVLGGFSVVPIRDRGRYPGRWC